MSLADDFNYLKTHLILLALVAGLAWGGIYGVENLVARHDASTATRMEQVAAQMTAANVSIQKQTADAIQQLAQQNQMLASQVGVLQQTINARDAQLVQLQAQVKNMQPPALAAEWPKYVKQGTVAALPDGVKLDVPAAQDTLSQLEALPVALADKQNLVESNQKLSQELSNSSEQLSKEQGALKSEQDTHAADNKACVADKAQLKSDARKSKTKIAGIFLSIGFVLAKALAL